MAKKYRVTLTNDERDLLEKLIRRGQAAARKLAHARILLQVDEAPGLSGRPDADVAKALNVSVGTVERVRHRFVEDGFEAALTPKPSERVNTRLLDGAQEARLIALACSAPPEGKPRWTLRLLSERLVALEIAETASYETVRQVLKKRAQAASPENVGHSADGLGRVRRGPGRRPDRLSATVCRRAASGLFG